MTMPEGATEPQGSPEGPHGTQADDDAASQQLASLIDSQGSGDKADPGPDTVEYWKQMARKHETRAKQQAAQLKPLSAKAAEFDKLQESQKTEQQKLTERAERAEAEAAKAVALHHRVLAAAAHDLPPELIDYLGGGTEEEITLRAESLARIINERAAALAAAGSQQQQNGHQRRPVESLRPGAAPASEARPQNTNDYFRTMLHRK